MIMLLCTQARVRALLVTWIFNMNTELEILVNSFKPEFGNLDHIDIVRLLGKLKKQKSEKEIEFLEKILIQKLTKVCKHVYKLRPYQQRAFDAIKKNLNVKGASLVVMPTASGKSHVIAHTATLSDNVLILQPSQELLAQNLEKLKLLVPAKDIGIYSASFGKKEIKKFTFATIQSVYKNPQLFSHIKLVIIDECHNVALRSLGTMYKSFLDKMGSPKCFGFTATPYRLEVGYKRFKNGDLVAMTMLKMLNRMRHKTEKGMFWKKIVYYISHERLLEQGYLSPIKYIHEPLMPYSEIPVNKSRSDYNLEGYTQAIVGFEAKTLATINEAQKRYKSVLVFCSSKEQAENYQNIIKGSELIVGDTNKKKRVKLIAGFKDGTIKTMFNVGVLTTGFDHPALDCIVLLRPTRSPLLYNQIIGRLTRLAEGKECGTVIDLTGTCKRMGKIETFKLYKNERGLVNLRTEKHSAWHDMCLYSRFISKKEI